MTDNQQEASINTDKTIWTQPTTDYGKEDGNDKGIEPNVFVTKDGRVGFNHYGTHCSKTIKEWVSLSTQEKSKFDTATIQYDPTDIMNVKEGDVIKMLNIENLQTVFGVCGSAVLIESFAYDGSICVYSKAKLKSMGYKIHIPEPTVESTKAEPNPYYKEYTPFTLPTAPPKKKYVEVEVHSDDYDYQIVLLKIKKYGALEDYGVRIPKDAIKEF